ncbi:DUF6461 domain-containing protein [Nonomuraea sp. KM90]|uniref:DUF6461 domain-containing protein n=1 Tax=Nonomuraea sp. KM90 TaxID=3457428 RepID=UPI003FCE95B3
MVDVGRSDPVLMPDADVAVVREDPKRRAAGVAGVAAGAADLRDVTERFPDWGRIAELEQRAGQMAGRAAGERGRLVDVDGSPSRAVGRRCEHDEMIATPGDYAWFSYERFPELAEAYCFTYVRGLVPERLVVRLGGRLSGPGNLSHPIDPLTAGQIAHRVRSSRLL